MPIFISIFMLVSFLGLNLFGGFLLLTMMSGMEDFHNYYKLDKWGFTIAGLKLFWGITLCVGWGAWFWLGVLVERIFKVQILRRSLFLALPRKTTKSSQTNQSKAKN